MLQKILFGTMHWIQNLERCGVNFDYMVYDIDCIL